MYVPCIILYRRQRLINPALGMNDNASGTFVLLRLAEFLAEFRTENAVRFSWWSGEHELSHAGSSHYLKTVTPEQLTRTRLYLDVNSLASSNSAYELYTGNSSQLDQSGLKWAAAAKSAFSEFFENIAQVNYTEYDFYQTLFTNFEPFEVAGVPCTGLSAGSRMIKSFADVQRLEGQQDERLDPDRGGIRDDIERMSTEALQVTSLALAWFLATLATFE
jgi:aminopeptidase Y